MKRTLRLFAVMLTALWGVAATATAQKITLDPDRTTNENAVYNAADKSVTLTATAPKYTIMDWETYLYEELTHIDSVTISRRPSGKFDNTQQIATVKDVTVGGEVKYIDKTVEADSNYEYLFTVYVDGLNSTNGYITVYTGLLPGNISNFTASVANYKVGTVDISVTAPTKMKDGSALANDVCIDVLKGSTWDGYEVVHTFENVKAAQTYTWKHEVSEMDQTIEYRAYARSGKNGKGVVEYATTHVGLVAPETPQNFKAVRQGDNVVLTWEKPLTGRYNGDYDAENTTYKLTRVYLDKSEVIAATNISGYTYTDSPEADEEESITYQLVAVNSEGESATPAVSNQVAIGKALELPFEESFFGSKFTHKGWITATSQNDPYFTYKAWNLYANSTVYYLPEDKSLAVMPQDNDGGLACCLFYGHSEDGQTESLISPHVNPAGADNVELKFNYWEMASNATKNEIKVWVSRDDNAWELLWASTLKEEFEPQWSEVTLPIVNTKANGNIRIKIDAIRHDGPITNVLLDNITMTELDATGINTVKPAIVGEAEYYTLSGVRINKPATRGTYIVKNGDSVKKIMVK